ncbi:hypothetical protein ACH4UT_08905 [Streptomyces sp. NPDC020799]|uniref:hypothetical protein n=1 Tax=Streptomyces sp. NPDC020799 TaxID=3365091 RepID=UPI00379A6DBE
MSDWSWEYDPDEEHVSAGLPPGVMAEVERLATELAALGRDAEKVGRSPRSEGGVRHFDFLGGRGFLSFLVVPRHCCVYVCDITWYG